MGSNTSFKLFPSLNSSTKKGSDRVSSVKIVAVIFRLFEYMMQSFLIYFIMLCELSKQLQPWWRQRWKLKRSLCTYSSVVKDRELCQHIVLEKGWTHIVLHAIILFCWHCWWWYNDDYGTDPKIWFENNNYIKRAIPVQYLLFTFIHPFDLSIQNKDTKRVCLHSGSWY